MTRLTDVIFVSYNKTSIKRNILTIKQNTSGSRSGQGLINTPVHDRPLYHVCPDVLSLVGKLFFGKRVRFIESIHGLQHVYVFICICDATPEFLQLINYQSCSFTVSPCVFQFNKVQNTNTCTLCSTLYYSNLLISLNYIKSHWYSDMFRSQKTIFREYDCTLLSS